MDPGATMSSTIFSSLSLVNCILTWRKFGFFAGVWAMAHKFVQRRFPPALFWSAGLSKSAAGLEMTTQNFNINEQNRSFVWHAWVTWWLNALVFHFQGSKVQYEFLLKYITESERDNLTWQLDVCRRRIWINYLLKVLYTNALRCRLPLNLCSL